PGKTPQGRHNLAPSSHVQKVTFDSTMGTVDVVYGRVVGIDIDDQYIDSNGMVDVLKMQPIARMG
ncbi:MAG: hypothetical protein Q8M33_00795, partial [Hydrogenophaga sp.]|nr:hypothetical protein [Hydrogenophaga sp.]